ncbi:hypothetical protein GLA29479_2854 [Lysobacter antibioticus]|nr:hypothetical protein GLA29479_2854 [Lysobacter antibioticus]
MEKAAARLSMKSMERPPSRPHRRNHKPSAPRLPAAPHRR